MDRIDLNRSFASQPRAITGGVRTPLITHTYPEREFTNLPENVAARAREAQLPQIDLDRTLRAARSQGQLSDFGLMALGRDCALLNRVNAVSNERMVMFLLRIVRAENEYARQVAAYDETREQHAQMDEAYVETYNDNIELRGARAELLEINNQLRTENTALREGLGRPSTESTTTVTASWENAYVSLESVWEGGKPRCPTLIFGFQFGDVMLERGLSIKVMKHSLRKPNLGGGLGICTNFTDWSFFLEGDVKGYQEARFGAQVQLPFVTSAEENWSLYAKCATPKLAPCDGTTAEAVVSKRVFTLPSNKSLAPAAPVRTPGRLFQQNSSFALVTPTPPSVPVQQANTNMPALAALLFVSALLARLCRKT